MEKPLTPHARRREGAAGADDAGDPRVRGQRTGAHGAAAVEPAVVGRRRRYGRVDGHAARAAPRGGRPRRGGEGDRLQRARPRDPGRRRARLRAEPPRRRGAARRDAPRLRDQRAAASSAARLPASPDRPRLVRDDAREVAQLDHRRGRAVHGLAAGGRLPRARVRGGAGRAGHPHQAALADGAAGDPGVPLADALRRAGPVRDRGTRVVGPGAGLARGVQRRRRRDLGGRGARRAGGRVRLARVELRVGRRPGRARALLPRDRRGRQRPAAHARVELGRRLQQRGAARAGRRPRAPT